VILTYRKFGRLGNRLFLFAHLIAFAELHKINIANPAFSEFRHLFPFFENSRWCRYHPLNGKIEARKGSAAFVRISGLWGTTPTVRFWDARDIIFDGEDEFDPRVQLMRNAPSVVFEGWKFRSRTKIQMIMPRLREVFAPRADFSRIAQQRMEKARHMGDLVIGIHVRLDDYRGTENYFTIDEFARNLLNLEALFAPLKIAFIVCSPESIDPTLFPVNCIIVAPDSVGGDLCTLAACDYILGPPSTFSGWASFYGEKPLFTMQHERPIIDAGKAEIVRW
jgi:hypothetical protein